MSHEQSYFQTMKKARDKTGHVRCHSRLKPNSSLQLFLQFLTFFHVCFDFTVLFERKFDSIGNLLNQINKFLC
jgi:hypothetical protein